MAEVITNGVRLHVQQIAPTGGVSADAPVVVLVHGMVIDNLASLYFPFGNALADAGCRVICYDQRGHGKSERTPSGYDISSAMADLAGVLTELGVDKPVHIVGNSYGGSLALRYGLEFPDRVASLSLIEPPFRLDDLGEEMARSLSQVLDGLSDDEVEEWLKFGASRGVRRIVRTAKALLGDTTIAADMLATKPFSPEALQALKVPVLAIYGGNSEIVDQGEMLARLVPDCELVVLERHTHMVVREATDYLRELLRWWVLRRDEEKPTYELDENTTFELADWVMTRTVPTDLNAEHRATRATTTPATSAPSPARQ
jgi:pimeloyl-ACP methyl ester carboxylesterase